MLKQRKNTTMIAIGIVIAIVLLITLISVNRLSEKTQKVISNIKKEEITKEFTYEVYSNENNILKLFIVAKDEGNGVSTIKYPDGDMLRCNGKKEVAVDYKIEQDGEYYFEATTTTSETIPLMIKVDDDYRKKLIDMEKLQDYGTATDYKVDYKEKRIESKFYYSIGENSENWIETNEKTITVDRYDLYFNNVLNEDGTLTVNLKKVTCSGNDIVKVSRKINLGDGSDFSDIIKFGETVWDNGKASVEISTNTSYYIEYQIDVTTGTWIRAEKAGTSIIATNLNHGNIIYARITNGSNTSNYTTFEIKDTIQPEEFTVDVTNITASGFKISGNTIDNQSGLKDYTYVVQKIEGGNTSAKANTKQQSNNINSVNYNNNNIINSDRSSNIAIRRKWFIWKSTASKNRTNESRSKRKYKFSNNGNTNERNI